MGLSYVGDLLERRFGRGWWQGGHLEVKFTNITWHDETLYVRGVITGHRQQGDRTHADFFAWAEKDDGTVVIIGEGVAYDT